jgi:GT2 family glycosyltransferase
MVESEFPQVRLIKSSENIGYARANNLGIHASTGKNILLLNSDTIVNTAILQETFNLLESDPKIGVLGCKLIGLNGEVQESYSFEYPFGPRTGGPNCILDNGLIECALVWGAFFLIKREVIDQVGMFDEDFFMFYEDVEWCWRIHKAGWKIVYDPNHSIIHNCRASCNKLNQGQFDKYLFTSECMICKKHMSPSEFASWRRKRRLHLLLRIFPYWLITRFQKNGWLSKILPRHIAAYRALLGRSE